MNIVVLLAGGSGTRMHSKTPKQYLVCKDHEIIEYTLTAFSSSDSVDKIAIVSNVEYIDQLKKVIADYGKVEWIIPGGKTRVESVYNAVSFLSKICNENDNVIFSDAVRPCITRSEIEEVLKELNVVCAVTTGVEVYETIIKQSTDGKTEIIPRDGVIRQTAPEGYKMSILKELYLEEPLSKVYEYKNIGIDQLVARGVPIKIVKSTPLNFKITTQDDLLVFETILRKGFNEVIGI